MIKRLTFVAATDEVAAAIDAPSACQPSRITLCTTLPQLTEGSPRHDAIMIAWFEDSDHLERYDRGVDVAAADLVVADEVIVRGAHWLAERWLHGGEKVKHMALARRQREMPQAEFSARWRDHGGTVGTAAKRVVTIPSEARGCAYVQNHPHLRTEGDWVYDAVNEVWFDDLDGLRRRVEWFRHNPPADELFAATWFLAVREEVIHQRA